MKIKVVMAVILLASVMLGLSATAVSAVCTFDRELRYTRIQWQPAEPNRPGQMY